jgi:hypothetical protein
MVAARPAADHSAALRAGQHGNWPGRDGSPAALHAGAAVLPVAESGRGVLTAARVASRLTAELSCNLSQPSCLSAQLPPASSST